MPKTSNDRSKFVSIAALSFVNFFGFTIFIPVLPFIVSEYGASTWVYGLLLAAYPAAQFFGAPILGEMSDRMGRKPVLLVSQLGTLLSWVIVAGSYFVGEISGINPVWPLGVLLFARLIDGITGGNIAVANAYLTDVTEPKDRTKAFGQIGAVTGVALLVGPAIGSLSSATRFGYLGMALVAFIVSLLTLIAMFRYLDESLPESERTKKTTTSWTQKVNIIRRIRKLETRPGGKFMLSLSAGFGLVLAGYTSIIVLFVIDRFGLSQTEVGILLLFIGSFLIFNQAVMVPRFTKKYGDLKTFVIGMCLLGTGFVAITLTQQLWLYVILYYVLNLGLSLVIPTSRSLLSQSVSQQNQGEVMGLDEALKSASNAVVPIAMGFVYAVISYRSFWIFAAIVFAIMVIFYFSKSRAILAEQTKQPQ